MKQVHRARAALLVALLASAAIVATQFPLSQLVGERTAVLQETHQLSQLKAENRSLAAQISALGQPGTIARLAQEKYGLVMAGEKSIVVLPRALLGAQPGGSSDPLGTTYVPKSDLVPTDLFISPGRGRRPSGTPEGFWGQLEQRLEFWKAVP